MPEVIHLTSVAGSPLVDLAGERLGRVEDLVARLDHTQGLPPIVGLQARIGGRDLFVPIDQVAEFGPDQVKSSTTKLNLAQFERRPGEVLLRGDVLDRDLINVATARLIRAREVELVCQDGAWRVEGVDPSLRPRLFRFLPRRFRGHDGEHKQFVLWSDVEPFLGHVPSSRLKLGNRRLRRLHPAQIADLVEAASHEEGEEILQAVGEDKELEADVFEELDDEHQVEFLRDRTDAEAAGVLARMNSDDAADLLLELDQERRLPILNLLPAARQRKIRSLLGHNPATAGGLMNPDFISVAADATVAQALEQVRSSELGAQQASIVCVVDAGKLIDSPTLAELVRADPQASLSSLVDSTVPTLSVDAEVPEVARVMSDYNLTAIPVLQNDGTVAGIIAVDDVLELLIPEEWRWRAGAARD